MEAENMVHSDSMSPASLGICEKLFRRWELKTSLTEGSRPDVPNRPSQYVWVCQVCPTSSSASGSNSPPGGDQVDNSAPLFTRVSKTYGRRSDETTTKSIIDLRPRVSYPLVPRALMDTLMLEHGVRYGQTVTTLHRSPITEHRSGSDREAVPPDHTPLQGLGRRGPCHATTATQTTLHRPLMDLPAGGVGSAMNQCEDREEGVPPSKTSLCGEHDSQTKAQRPEQPRPDCPGPGPGPGPGSGLSCVSLKSDRTQQQIHRTLSCVFMKSNHFRRFYTRKQEKHFAKIQHERPESGPGPGPSCVSLKSDRSMGRHVEFKDGQQSDDEMTSVAPHMDTLQFAYQPNISVDDALIYMLHRTYTHLDTPDASLLEENMLSFVKKELKKIQRVVSSDYPECLESQREDEEVLDGEDEEQRRSSREAFLKITLHFLRRMKQEELADCLQSRTIAAACRRKLKSNLQKKFQCVFEGIAKAGNPTLLNQIYTELYITEGGTAEVNDEHEGVAGIGKTVLTQKFTLDWAEDKANQDIHFTFPFTFRELNVLKEKKFSLVELVHQFFTETKEAGICRFEEFQVVFIFDGLDECRLPLDFHNNEILTDVTESTSVDVLLTNLIRGKLLPSARLWITTRPAAANQIPPECVLTW
ncbi:hypothetical protein L3Q82_001557 [Scortum barcoo]|uniref:Uncharacterized protein n=1 Tax=Scortum barcoo TaxID=214431 RepID=A0ACB8W7E3_9TELE|nr:hypothetical protein L3Q82_001557 [Scortum barcoo]